MWLSNIEKNKNKKNMVVEQNELVGMISVFSVETTIFRQQGSLAR